MPQTLAPSRVTARDRKGLQFMSVVEDAYNNTGLSEKEAQRINEAPGLGILIARFIGENRRSNLYKDEEIEVNDRHYPSDYKPNGLTVQIDRLQELFPGLGSANNALVAKIYSKGYRRPEKAEGWFAVPNIWGGKNQQIFGTTYSEAVLKVLTLLRQTRDTFRIPTHTYGQIDERELRQRAKTTKFLAALSEAQGNPEILVIPAQFGLRHIGRSVRRAHEVFEDNEFALGIFASGVMLLTHPERFQDKDDDMWIFCSGDGFAPGDDGSLNEAPSPFFHFARHNLTLETFNASFPDNGGVASGFLPE